MILVLNKMVSLFVQALGLGVFLSPSHAHPLLLSFFSRSVRGFWIRSQGASNRDQSMRVRCLCQLWAEPGASLVGLFLADYWDHSSDAESRAFKSNSEWHAGPSSAANYPPAPDERPGPDHCHSHREPDPACDQHAGHHALPHQARPAGKGFLSRQPWLPGHLSLPSFFYLGSINEK